MDRQLLIIIIFLAVTFTLAGILVMGAIPKIFQTGEQVNQTQEVLNQTKLFLMEQGARDNQTRHEDLARLKQTLIQTQHEDQARDNQTQHEDQAREKQNMEQFAMENEARDIQRQQIVSETTNETNMSLKNLEKNLKDFIEESTERQLLAVKERKIIIDSIATATAGVKNITSQLLNMTKADQKGADAHRELSMQHHKKLIKLVEGLDKNIIGNLTSLQQQQQQKINK